MKGVCVRQRPAGSLRPNRTLPLHCIYSAVCFWRNWVVITTQYSVSINFAEDQKRVLFSFYFLVWMIEFFDGRVSFANKILCSTSKLCTKYMRDICSLITYVLDPCSYRSRRTAHHLGGWTAGTVSPNNNRDFTRLQFQYFESCLSNCYWFRSLHIYSTQQYIATRVF